MDGALAGTSVDATCETTSSHTTSRTWVSFRPPGYVEDTSLSPDSTEETNILYQQPPFPPEFSCFVHVFSGSIRTRSYIKLILAFASLSSFMSDSTGPGVDSLIPRTTGPPMCEPVVWGGAATDGTAIEVWSDPAGFHACTVPISHVRLIRSGVR